MGWPAENPAQDRGEIGQGKTPVSGVEGDLIPALAESYAGLVIGACAISLAPVRILIRLNAAMVELEYPVMANDPVHLFAHIGAQERRGEFRVIVRREQVAKVMQQGADDQIVVRPIPRGARRGLQHVVQDADLVADKGPRHSFERNEDSLRRRLDKWRVCKAPQLEVCRRGVAQLGVGDGLYWRPRSMSGL